MFGQIRSGRLPIRKQTFQLFAVAVLGMLAGSAAAWIIAQLIGGLLWATEL
jgi:hypothetical protein